MATDTLDCTSDNILVRLAVGENNYFANVSIYSPEKTYHIPREALTTAHLVWSEQFLLLEKAKNTIDGPEFKVNVTGRNGKLKLDGKNEVIKCDWRR
ncbi:MAG TPA: hypothetical protein VK138_01910 [Acidiferrobacterales bacterium]|nr:hypothetical protein [Acidiferrobacterales bacterium]